MEAKKSRPCSEVKNSPPATAARISIDFAPLTDRANFLCFPAADGGNPQDVHAIGAAKTADGAVDGAASGLFLTSLQVFSFRNQQN
jgi:hypothetical protein